jgi:hypothetical protein
MIMFSCAGKIKPIHYIRYNIKTMFNEMLRSLFTNIYEHEIVKSLYTLVFINK